MLLVRDVLLAVARVAHFFIYYLKKKGWFLVDYFGFAFLFDFYY